MGPGEGTEVALSTRVRRLRNLQGYPFPGKASDRDLEAISAVVSSEIRRRHVPLSPFALYSHADRDYLVSCRLISPEFKWQEPGRTVMLSGDRDIALMVNEEDHLRLQTILGGWRLEEAIDLSDRCLQMLNGLSWARTTALGYLAASPANMGKTSRHSVMLHLIGLGQCRRLPKMMTALREKGLSARGAFGESSRAVGAFLQVSDIKGDLDLLVGAVDVLIKEELAARAQIEASEAERLVDGATGFIRSQNTMTLSDALRALGLVRWGAIMGIGPAAGDHRRVDVLLTKLELGELDPGAAAEGRAALIRKSLGL